MDWREACKEDVLCSIGWLADWARAHNNDEYMGSAGRCNTCVLARAIIRKFNIPETVRVSVSVGDVKFYDDVARDTVVYKFSDEVEHFRLALDYLHKPGEDVIGRTVKAVLNGMGYIVS